MLLLGAANSRPLDPQAGRIALAYCLIANGTALIGHDAAARDIQRNRDAAGRAHADTLGNARVRCGVEGKAEGTTWIRATSICLAALVILIVAVACGAALKVLRC